MRLSLSEIRSRAITFAHDWADASSERAEAQSFWQAFFNVFGINRRSVASFEEKVRNLGGSFDRIDVFYTGVMLAEHKSRGQDLSKAASQAFDYVQSLTREGRGDEVPKYIVVSDFARFVVYDLEADDPATPIAKFPTAKLHANIRRFGFLWGQDTKPVDPEDPINVKAVEILGELHDALEQGGYRGHQLERFLVRVLFCLFAEDTGIFDPDTFRRIVEQARGDGSDLGPALARLFRVLDTKPDDRPANLPEDLAALPYVNGELFAEKLDFAEFTGPMRAALLKCCNFNWSRISPAVFGSLFQSVMAGEEGQRQRRQIGAHYTSERDIMKLIRSLFLDDLQAELKACGSDQRKLKAFQDKLAGLRFLDPACGCGNFLVVTYRELRKLELEVLRKLHGGRDDSVQLFSGALLKVDVDQMHGIEIEEWPARIAEVAMWLIDHQMNLRVSEEFGKPVTRLPLKKGAKIHLGNALRTDWNTVLPASECSYVLGNPPFVGAKYQTDGQRGDMAHVCGSLRNAGLLDYVCGWYLKASEYMDDSGILCAFVSTNSISQGEQVGVLWPELFRRGLKIQFAHRTFQWMSEARGAAHVHVVIVGFTKSPRSPRRIYDYEGSELEPTVVEARNISPYLVGGPDVAITNRSTPLCISPDMGIGNKPIDDGNYLFTEAEMKEFIREEPGSKRFFHRFYGAQDFINSTPRYCLWLGEASASDLRAMPKVMTRVRNVKHFRLASKSAPTIRIAETPTRFHVEYIPTSAYLLIPRVSSERRKYIPMGYLSKNDLAGDSCLVVPSATLFHFGVLTSEMHMAWVRQVCGRLESRYRYSNKLVYNNFPWPQDVSPARKTAVEAAAQGVLDARDQFKGQTLADLYDPLTMPKALRDAHKKLDREVDKCYRSQPFQNERSRVEFLFNLYLKLTEPLLPARPARRRRS